MPESIVKPTRAGDSMLPGLTCLDQKAELYSKDPYFLEGWYSVFQHWGGQANSELWGLACMILKPESIVTRDAAAIVARVKSFGYSVMYAQPFQFDRHTIRDLWRYQINNATVDRLQIKDMQLQDCDSIFLLLRAASNREPASVSLSALKGPAAVEDRRPADLRSGLSLQSRLLSAIHVADEPADVVRELSVLFSYDVVDGLLSHSDRGKEYDVGRVIEGAYRRWPKRDLSLGNVLDKIEATASGQLSTRSGRAARAACRAARRGSYSDWRELLRLAEEAGTRLEIWDRVVVGAELAELDIPGVEQLLAAPEPGCWEGQ
jgi:hypothetical protein